MSMEHALSSDVGMPQSRGGTVLGIWLSGVFLTSLGGWFDHGRDNTMSMALLGGSVVWPFLYFAVSRHRFFPHALPFGATAALALFVLASALSCFFSPVPLLSV